MTDNSTWKKDYFYLNCSHKVYVDSLRDNRHTEQEGFQLEEWEHEALDQLCLGFQP